MIMNGQWIIIIVTEYKNKFAFLKNQKLKNNLFNMLLR